MQFASWKIGEISPLPETRPSAGWHPGNLFVIADYGLDTERAAPGYAKKAAEWQSPTSTTQFMQSCYQYHNTTPTKVAIKKAAVSTRLGD